MPQHSLVLRLSFLNLRMELQDRLEPGPPSPAKAGIQVPILALHGRHEELAGQRLSLKRPSDGPWRAEENYAILVEISSRQQVNLAEGRNLSMTTTEDQTEEPRTRFVESSWLVLLERQLNGTTSSFTEQRRLWFSIVSSFRM